MCKSRIASVQVTGNHLQLVKWRLRNDAEGLTVARVIDPGTFQEPGLEHKEDLFTATCACARGGVTSFLEMPNTRP